jgi:hypothetical protein
MIGCIGFFLLPLFLPLLPFVVPDLLMLLLVLLPAFAGLLATFVEGFVFLGDAIAQLSSFFGVFSPQQIQVISHKAKIMELLLLLSGNGDRPLQVILLLELPSQAIAQLSHRRIHLQLQVR